MSDLELIPDSDLIEELMKRFDHIVIGGYKDSEFGPNVDREIGQWHGDAMKCVGVCELLKTNIIKQYMEDGEEIQE